MGIVVSEFVKYNMSPKNEIGREESWKVLKNKIKNQTPFCYVRFNEGESRLVANINGTPRGRGKTMEPEEIRKLGKCSINKTGKDNQRPNGKWNYDEDTDKEFHQLMLESLTQEGENYFASLCNIKTFSNYRYQNLLQMQDNMKELPNQVLSAHMPHQENIHHDILKHCENHGGKVNLIINETGMLGGIPFKFNKVWKIANDDAHRKSIGVIDEINNDIKECNIQNEIFLGCAGPFTNVLLHQLWKENPTNYYIDAGTTLDGFLFEHVRSVYLERLGYSHYERKKRKR